MTVRRRRRTRQVGWRVNGRFMSLREVWRAFGLRPVDGPLPRHVEVRVWFERRVDRVASWLVEHGHSTAGLRLWRACGLMSGHRPARRSDG